MRTFKVSKESKLTIEEKKTELEKYDTEDLLSVFREYESYPRRYDKEIITIVVNKLFEKGVLNL